MPSSSQFLTVAISTLITALETLLFSNVGIDWIGILMLSGPPLVLAEVIDEEWPALLLWLTLGNMKEQDVNENCLV